MAIKEAGVIVIFPSIVRLQKIRSFPRGPRLNTWAYNARIGLILQRRWHGTRCFISPIPESIVPPRQSVGVPSGCASFRFSSPNVPSSSNRTFWYEPQSRTNFVKIPTLICSEEARGNVFFILRMVQSNQFRFQLYIRVRKIDKAERNFSFSVSRGNNSRSA